MAVRSAPTQASQIATSCPGGRSRPRPRLAPGAIALCANPADVQACVAAAAASTTPIAARSGGHSYVGYSTPDNALVVDLSGLSGSTVNPDGSMVVGTVRRDDDQVVQAVSGRIAGLGG